MNKLIANSVKEINYSNLITAFYIKKYENIIIEFNTQETDSLIIKNHVIKNNILRSLVHSYPSVFVSSNANATLCDYWIDFCQDNLYTKDFKKLSLSFNILESHLTLRSFIIGYSFNLS